MSDDFSKIKNQMIDETFKDIYFSEERKRKVIKQIRFQNTKKNHPKFYANFKQVFNGILSVSVIMGLFLFLMDQTQLGKMDTQSGNKSSNITPENQATGTIYQEHRDISTKNYDIFQHDRTVLSKYPEQSKIVQKMYYSWDYINNTQGSYEWGHPELGDIYSYTFNIDFINQKNYSTSKIIKDGKVIETEKTLFINGKATRYLEGQNIFTNVQKSDSPGSETDDAFRFQYITSGSEFMIGSEWLDILNNNYKNWSYKENTRFGMPVYEIKGTIPKKISESLEGKFTMIVSKDTGALLDLKCYGSGDKEIFYITTKDIQFNKGIQEPDHIFNLDVSKAKQVNWEDYIKNTVGSKAFKGVKTGWDTPEHTVNE